MASNSTHSSLVIGDSWASALESDTGLHRGWPFFSGVPYHLRQGISGSTAVQWARDEDGRLTKAIAASKNVDCVVISLFGNDVRHFADDGKITLFEVFDSIIAMRKVIGSFSHVKHVVLLAYCDPYFGANLQSSIGIPLINSVVRLSSAGTFNTTVFQTGDILRPEHFDGSDFHSNMAGHQALALALSAYISKL